MSTKFIDSTDKGDHVICLHSSMSSSRQWQGLVQRLQPAYRVTAVDLHGYGKGPRLETGETISLQREVSLLAELMDGLDAPIHLVGHSYGGAVAIKAARIAGRRVNSLTLYEPIIFSELFADAENLAAAFEVSRLIEEIKGDYRSGDLFHAAQRFVDYWSGKGSWDAIPFDKQLVLSQKIPLVLANFQAVVSEPNLLAGLATLQIPTLFLSGGESPASVNAISRLLKRELPRAVTHRFCGLGHMGPITHGDIVNPRIAAFIQRQSRAANRKNYAQAA